MFTIIWYMKNSQLTIYPCGFIAQWIKQYHKVTGLNSVQAQIFFGLLFQLLKLKAHCEDHKFH